MVITAIGIIISLSVGIILLGASRGEPISTLIGFSIIVLGGLFSWISSFILYGFGQLIDSAQKIEEHFCVSSQGTIKKAQTEQKQTTRISYRNNSENKQNQLICNSCGNEIHIGDFNCSNCGKIIDWSKTDNLI